MPLLTKKDTSPIISNSNKLNTTGTNDDLSTIMISFDYSSNTNTFGNFNQFIRQPSYSPSINFFSKINLDIGLTRYSVANSDDSLTSSTYELDMNIGYNIYLFKDKVLLYPGYSRFFYSKNSGSLKSMFSDNIQLRVCILEK